MTRKTQIKTDFYIVYNQRYTRIKNVYYLWKSVSSVSSVFLWDSLLLSLVASVGVGASVPAQAGIP